MAKCPSRYSSKIPRKIARRLFSNRLTDDDRVDAEDKSKCNFTIFRLKVLTEFSHLIAFS